MISFACLPHLCLNGVIFKQTSSWLYVRWYCRYALSYRDLEEMMQERGMEVDHSTINRWVLKYAPPLDKRIRPHLRPTNDSWRVDETVRLGEGTVEVAVSSGGFRRQYSGLHANCQTRSCGSRAVKSVKRSRLLILRLQG